MTDNVRGLDAARVNHGFIAAIVVVATIGGFMFGYDSGVINGTQKGLEAAFDLGRLGVGVNVGAILVGSALGAFGAGRVADALGRRHRMVLAAGLFLCFSAQADLRLTKAFDTGIGRHEVTVGTYGANYGDDFRMRYQDYLFEVAARPRTLDLYAYDANGRILGSVTKNGVLRYATTVNGGKSDITMYALYGNDNWQITDRLRIDAGIRHEKYAFRGYGLLQGQIDLGDRTTLADDATRYFTGAVKYNPYDMSVTNWTVGGDFDPDAA